MKPRKIVLKTGRVVWWAVIDGPPKDGRRSQVKLRAATRAGLLDAISEARTNIRRETFVVRSTTTFGEYAEAWLAGRDLRPSTLASYRGLYAKHIEPALGVVRLQGLSGEQIETLLAEKRSTGLSPRTVQLMFILIRKMLSDAVARGYVVRNVTDALERPRAKAPEMRTWTAEQVRQFLSRVADSPYRVAWIVLLATGIRRGELLGLRWSDLDLDAGRLQVRRSLVSVGYELHVSEPKTDRGRRSIALDASSVAALRQHRKRQLEQRVALGLGRPGPESLVIARPDGSPVHPDRLTKLFEAATKAAGLPRIRLHDLRHTHASLALAGGVHPKVVSERLGHASIAITLDTYSHAIPQLDQAAAETVGALIFGSL